MTCASCASAVSSAIEEAVPEAEEVGVNLMGMSAVAVVPGQEAADRIIKAVEDAGYSCQLSELTRTVDSEANNGEVQVRAAIGGMTCASCSSTITSLAQNKDFVKSANIDLMSHSGVFVLTSENHVAELKEVVEDAGYDFEVDTVTPVGGSRQKAGTKRTVELSVTGMHCEHCPPRVMSVLDQYGEAVVIDDPISLKDPYVRLTYQPDAPRLTIRSILRGIEAAAPEFSVSIVHPKTIEDRAAEMARAEHRQISLRLAASFVVAIPTFIIGVVAMSLLPSSNHVRQYFEEPMWAGSVARMNWALFILATPVYFFCADVFHVSAIQEVWSMWRSRTSWTRRLFRFGSMNLLISLGTSIAYFASIAVIGLGAAQEPNADMHDRGFSTTYFDSVVFLTMFLLVGRFLDALSRSKMYSAVTLLTNLRPDTVNLVKNPEDLIGKSTTPTVESVQHERLPTDMIEVGDYAVVLPGENCSTDGVIVAGATTFDLSSLTGESAPVRKAVDDEVFSGTVNSGGAAVVVRVTAVDEGSMLSDIIQIVRQGQLHKAPIERVAERITRVFVPIVTALAVVTWIIWMSLGLAGALPDHYLDTDIGGWPVWSLEFAITVFVIACPCGIGLAAPTALYVGSGIGAKHGILARGGGEAFQEASNVDIICFDKTGTLTKGTGLSIVASRVLQTANTPSQLSERQLVRLAGQMEVSSNHPLAAGVTRYADEVAPAAGSSDVWVEGLADTPGRGISGTATVETQKYITYIGNEAFMAESGVDATSLANPLFDEWRAKGWSVILLAIKPVGTETTTVQLALAAADELRPETKDVIATLNARGIETWMISGDNMRTAQAVAAQCGIPPDNVVANVLPVEKATKVQWLQKTRKHRGDTSRRAIVAMVGDGVNDAPALSVADVGIAVGSGADIALTSAKFVLLNTELKSLVTLFELSRAVLRRVKFNFGWACIYNLIGIPIAAGVIYPYNNSRLSPVWASLAMALSSVSVVTSSVLLRFFKPSIE